MEVQAALRPSHYFENHTVHPCPLRKPLNGLRISLRKELSSRKCILRFILFVVLIYFVYIYCNEIAYLIKSLTQGQDWNQQPIDGGTGGQSGKGSSYSNEKSDPGGGSHDLPQAPPSGGSGSSSSGNNGNDDPNKRQPTRTEPKEVESREEESNEDDSSQSNHRKDQMVAVPLQSALKPQWMTDLSRQQGSNEFCSNPWMSPAYAPVKSFDHLEQLRMCPLEGMVIVHEPTSDEQPLQQLPQSVVTASIGEEQLSLEPSGIVNTGGILDELPFYTTIEIRSFSGPQSPPHLGQEVSTESILALHANTYYELAQLEVVQEQVLQAAQTTEPFEYTLAIVMYDDGTQLLIPCLPHTEFDPAEDVHIVAVPSDCVLSQFTVHINPHLHHI